MTIYRGAGSAGSGVAADYMTDSDLADATTITLGDALVGFKQSNTSGALTGATARTIHSKLQEAVSALDFMTAAEAADVMGKTALVDVTSAVQAAITASSGKRLRLPAGNYLIDFTGTTAFSVPADVELVGDGTGATTVTFVPDSVSYRQGFNNSYGGLVLRDLKLTAIVPVGGEFAFFAHASTGLTLDNVDVDGAITNSGATVSHTAYAFLLSANADAHDITATNCDFHRLSYVVLKAGSNTRANRRLSFAHCDFYGNYNEDLSFNSPHSSSVMDDVQVYMCRFRDGSGNGASLYQLYCAFASVTNFRVGGCSFSGTAAEAVHIEENSKYGTITGNNINIDNEGGSTCGAIQLTDNNVSGTSYMPQFITISGNTVKNAGTAKETGNYGIWLVDNGSAEVPGKKIIVEANNIDGYEMGVNIAGATLDDSCSIRNNVIANCAQGIRGSFGSLNVSGNTTDTCDTGIYSSNGGAAQDHTFVNCTLNVDAVNRPFMLVNPTFLYSEFAISATSSVYKALVVSGANDRHYGVMSSYVMTETGANAAMQCDEVTWDGTTFTATEKVKYEPGSCQIASVQNSGNLAAQVYSTPAVTTARLQVKFNGMLLVAV